MSQIDAAFAVLRLAKGYNEGEYLWDACKQSSCLNAPALAAFGRTSATIDPEQGHT